MKIVITRPTANDKFFRWRVTSETQEECGQAATELAAYRAAHAAVRVAQSRLQFFVTDRRKK